MRHLGVSAKSLNLSKKNNKSKHNLAFKFIKETKIMMNFMCLIRLGPINKVSGITKGSTNYKK